MPKSSIICRPLCDPPSIVGTSSRRRSEFMTAWMLANATTSAFAGTYLTSAGNPSGTPAPRLYAR